MPLWGAGARGPQQPPSQRRRLPRARRAARPGTAIVPPAQMPVCLRHPAPPLLVSLLTRQVWPGRGAGGGPGSLGCGLWPDFMLPSEPLLCLPLVAPVSRPLVPLCAVTALLSVWLWRVSLRVSVGASSGPPPHPPPLSPPWQLLKEQSPPEAVHAVLVLWPGPSVSFPSPIAHPCDSVSFPACDCTPSGQGLSHR